MRDRSDVARRGSGELVKQVADMWRQYVSCSAVELVWVARIENIANSSRDTFVSVRRYRDFR